MNLELKKALKETPYFLDCWYKDTLRDEFAISIVDELLNASISFLEIEKLSGKVYSFLKNKKIKSDDVVMICLPRSYYAIACMIGVWKCGAAFTIVEDTYPKERIAYIKNNCNCKFFIDINIWKIIIEYKYERGYIKTNLHDAAFIVYTSGTTGYPKGIIHEYGNIKINDLSNNNDKVDNKSHYALISPLYYIASIKAVLSRMLKGCKLFLVSYATIKNYNKLKNYFIEKRITATFLTPSMIRVLGPNFGPYMKYVVTGGESVNGITINNAKLINTYSMSECAFTIARFEIDKYYDICPVGRPSFKYIKILLLDGNNKEVAEGKTGEVCFENPYMRGYTNTLHSKSSNKMFHSGDLGKKLPDGNWIIVGRSNNTVKINGNRVEPAEIEKQVNKVLGINRSIVKCFKEENHSYFCVFYENKIKVDENKVKNQLKKSLPYYMIPLHFIYIEKIPLLENGKIDYSKLKNYNKHNYISKFEEPVTDMQQKVCKAFSEVFGKPNISINDDFFNLGGDSITAIKLQSIIPRITYEILLENKSPKKIAMALNNNKKHTYKFSYTIKSGTPLTQNQLYIYYDLNLNKCDFPYLIEFKYPVSNKISIVKIKEVINKLIETHPILNARFALKNNKPWIYYDSKPQIICYKKPPKLNINQSLSMFYITDNYIHITLHHYICDAISVQILKENLKDIFNGKTIKKDEEFLKIPIYDSYEEKHHSGKKPEEILTNIYKDFVYPSTSLDFVIHAKAKIWQNCLPISLNILDMLSKKYKTPIGIILMCAYSNALLAYTQKNDIAFNYITNGRKYQNTSKAVSFFAKRNIMRYKTKDINRYIKPSDFYSLYLSINANSYYNAWEIENKYNIHTDLFFNYIEDSNTLPIKNEIEFIDPIGVTRNFMATFTKAKNVINSTFIVPEYCKTLTIKKIFHNLNIILDGWYKKVDMQNLELSYGSKNIIIKYDDYQKFHNDNLLKNIITAFKKVFINKKITENTNFCSLCKTLEQAIDIANYIETIYANITLCPVDIIRYKTPKNILNCIYEKSI